MTPKPAGKLHSAYIASIAIKGLNGVLETILGLTFLLTGSLHWLIHRLSQMEMIADPHGWVGMRLHRALAEMSVKTQSFAAIYLFAHGVIKIILAWGLLRDRRWAFPVSMILLGLFVCYQLVHFAETRSIVLPFLAAFDVLVIWLIWKEYKRAKRVGAMNS